MLFLGKQLPYVCFLLEMIRKYIEEQEGEIVDDGRFQIDSSL
jgi:hypothetical protein